MSYKSTLDSALEDLCYALGCASTWSKNKSKRLRNGHQIDFKDELTSGYFLYLSRRVSFSDYEEKFMDIFFQIFDELYLQGFDSSHTLTAAQEIAVRTSVMDVSVARYLSRNTSRFINIETLLNGMKLLSYLKYEGEQVKTSILVFNKDYETLVGGYSDKEKKIDSELVNLDSITIDNNLLKNVAFHRFVDGVSAFYVANNRLEINGYVAVLRNEYNLFQKNSSLVALAVGNNFSKYFYCVDISSFGDVEVFKKEGRLKILYRKGRWILFDSITFSKSIFGEEFDSSSVDSDLACNIFYSLSKIRKGAAVLCTSKTVKELSTERKDLDGKKLCIGYISNEDVFANLKSKIVGCSLRSLADTGELERVLMTDGLSVVDAKFKTLRDCNMIVDTSIALTKITKKEQGGGGRTTAVKAASFYGTAIKVSEDGPISVYRDGQKIYSLG